MTIPGLSTPLPPPPDWMRQGPLREGSFPSRLRALALTARVGTWLGGFLTVAFLTGLASHFAQHPLWGWSYPTRPVWLYRFTQGLHVATGIATIPLLLVKLWSVYPRLWQWPPARNLLHAFERLSLLVLVGSAVMELLSGLQNIFYWYPWGFFFTTTHYWTAWILAGSVLVHVAVKWVDIRTGWKAPLADGERAGVAEPEDGERAAIPAEQPGITRRGLLIGVASTIGVVAAVTVGETVRPLSAIDLLGPRRPDIGPQGVPVNKSAQEGGVLQSARSADYRLEVSGNLAGAQSFTLAQLQAMTQHDAALPIACVEGWSVAAGWSGVSVAELLAAAGVSASARVRVVSLERGGRYNSSILEPDAARDPLTLLALRLNGEELHIDHGYPCRLIAPDRPGVLQTKWVQRLEIL
jgi:DMSO/TMAO reductase YedYZ molybdopterin-dependent catalytic subunit